MARVGKLGLEFGCPCRLCDLVVDEEKPALVELDLVVLAVGDHLHRGLSPSGPESAAGRFLRKRKDQGNRLDLCDHDETVGIRRMNDVADVDLPDACYSRDGRGQAGVAQLNFCLIDQRLVRLDGGLQLVDLGLLRLDQLRRGVTFIPEAGIARQMASAFVSWALSRSRSAVSCSIWAW